ncbi:MAG: GNAT family N-acetyltransferase [Chloroflexi bacterium]|nr:GNAT family N-acetyltransferase [Chloroflexota bacterium]
MTFTIRPISAAEARPLRHIVLRPHQPPESIMYPGDDAPDSLHVGAFVDALLVGIATVVREAPPGESAPRAWRLRGMATLPQARRQGVGAALVRACLAHVAAHGGTMLWCLGRTSALAFYNSLGFQATGDEFDVPHTGPHFIMRRPVTRHSANLI